VSLPALCLLAFAASPSRAQENGAASPESQPAGAVDTASVASDSAAATGAQYVDPWGVKRSWGVAIGEVILINNLVWAFNEYLRGANFTQVNPRSWYENLFVKGFTYDDNHFNTNMFAHPYHGSTYFSAARTNGFNYWASLPFAIGGSFLWECCGETHPPSINDWIATSIGGAAIGETTYRLSSMVLDNTATGSERTWREVGALLINPVRGVNRLFSGRWSEVRDNPPERMPSIFANQLSVGARVIGEGESISENTQSNAFFQVDFNYGSPFSQENRDPFSYFLMGLQVNFSDKQALGRVQIRGNLFTSDLKVSDKVHHVFSVAQNYDYINNNAYEFGGQSVTASLLSRWNFSDTWGAWTALDLYGMLMGAVNSEFAFLAEFPPAFDQERFREYDFGSGGGPAIGVGLLWKGRDVLALRYRLTYLYTLNGSVQEGDEAWHWIHIAYAKAMFPIGRKFGIGADAGVFQRDSYYTCEITVGGEVFQCTNITQRNPQVRLYAKWLVGGGGIEVPTSN
jgi:hypothetical protein